jgi:hypothetical protein
MNFEIVTAIKTWYVGPSQRCKNGRGDLHSDPKMDFETFTAIQKWMLRPSQRSKNGFLDPHGTKNGC